MKNNNLPIVLTLILILFFSCKNESQIEVFGIKTKKKFLQLENANWFIGKWENLTETARFEEIWNKVNDSTFLGESVVIIARDTVFYEKMDLFQKSDSLILKISVKDQNNEKPVLFYLTKSNNNQLVFENPKHDFPNKIVYNKINSDSIVATIEGIKNGKTQSEAFPMKRTK